MNLRQMEVFQAVMREGTVTAGARSLGLSQPSVTEMLKHTETALGLRLFDRVKGRLRPTPEAELLFEEVQEIFERVGAFRRSSDALRETRVGSVNVATVSVLGLSLVPTLLGRFMATRPDIRARLQVRRYSDLVASVAMDRIDIGFSFQTAPDPRVIKHQVARQGLSLIFPKGHALGLRRRVTVADTGPYAAVTYAAMKGLGSIINGIFAQAGTVQRSVAEVEHIAQACSLVQSGIGIAVVDSFSDLHPMFPAVQQRPLSSPVTVTLEALEPRQRSMSRLATAFLDHVLNR